MNFTITETDYNRIDSMKSQLRLVADLAGRSTENNMFEMACFLEAMQDTAEGVIKSADALHEEMRGQERFDSLDALYLIELLAGKRPQDLPGGALSRITKHLAVESKLPGFFKQAFDTWTAYLVDQGATPDSEASEPVRRASKKAAAGAGKKGKAQASQRDRLAEGAAS